MGHRTSLFVCSLEGHCMLFIVGSGKRRMLMGRRKGLDRVRVEDQHAADQLGARIMN